MAPNAIRALLSILSPIATQTTIDVMKNILRFIPADYDNIMSDMNNFKESKSMVFENALYVQDGIQLNSNIFGSSPAITFNSINFKNKHRAVTKINAWASNATHGKISSLLSKADIADDTVLILLNALYFKATWKNKFSKSDTFPNTFTTVDGTEANVNMMNMGNTFMFYEDKKNLHFKMIELPFKAESGDENSHNYMMWILLPTEDQTLSALLKRLSFSKLKDYHKNMTEQYVYIRLPKFELNYDLNVKDVLSSMNMSGIFESSAFNVTSTEQAKIDKIVQKVFINVNEEGTEAVAASFATCK
jgi:serine protease inhibitor